MTVDITWLLLAVTVGVSYWVLRDTLLIKAKRNQRGKKWW